MTAGEAYKQLSLLLQAMYDRREAGNIANIVLAHITGFSGSERVLHKQDLLTQEQESFFHRSTSELLTHKPVQYVLHEAYFYGMKLYVDEAVLIPRPETEELVDWILEDLKNDNSHVHLMDVGTGSGCIAIAIKKKLPMVTVHAIDVSGKALQIAKQNAIQQQTEIHLSEVDILNKVSWKVLPALDYIISNPPYIKRNEAAAMNNNVLKYEPHLALFVPDNNPLLFYEAISTFGLQHLKNKGKLFFEINEVFANEVAELLFKKGYQNIEIKKDLQGKNRMIKAEVPPIP